MKHITRILIANRGEIVSRIARTCRGMGIATVGIYATPDRRAPYVRHVDEAICIGDPMGAASFLAIDTIVDAAVRAGAEAIHPGFGFLAENADFAQACADAGLVFIGPSPDAIRRMGSKIEAKKIATEAGVPVIPGFSAVGLGDGEIDARVREMGFPVLVKASAGGGGKGMRIVREAGALAAALESARREARNAFGDDALLIERYIDTPRHVEIQILGDTHGHLIHCFERECSIQRRHQKIVEEAPSPAVDADLRARMGAAAIALGRSLAYHGAGTVEFVVDPRGEFWFLEVNTRLQVEHPVTEEITGLDLVRLQIEIAEGRPLAIAQDDLRIRGHAIEVRVYAEDPRHDFLPSTGRLVCWEEPEVDGVRWESGVETGSAVTIHYDPMLAKVIAHAPTRREAALRLAATLRRMRVHGVRTNVALLEEILRHAAFLAGRTHTHFLETELVPAAGPSAAEIDADRVHAIAAALWQQERRRAAAAVLRGLPSGWRNNPSRMQDATYAREDDEAVEIRVEYQARRDGGFDVRGGETAAGEARVEAWDEGGVALALDGVQRRVDLIEEGDLLYAHSALGSSALRERPRFPVAGVEEVHGGCRAPMPGRILAVKVAVGDEVAKGQALVVLEAMKMEHEVTAPAAGKVEEILVAAGEQVEAGAVLVVVE